MIIASQTISDPSDTAWTHADLIVDTKFIGLVSEGISFGPLTLVNCNFNAVDWYWGIITMAIFVNCSFDCCDLRAGFHSSHFSNCTFTSCKIGIDELGGVREWPDTIVHECSFIDTDAPSCP